MNAKRLLLAVSIMGLVLISVQRPRAQARAAAPGTAARPGAAAPTTAPGAAATQPARHIPDQAQLDERFIKTMTGATLSGSFTEGATAAAGTDHYNIVSVKRRQGDNWEIVARLRFKAFDINVPLVIPVKWAGDTAVLTVDDLTIPGIGTYTARVMIFGDQYTGIWRGASHGGEMWGKIEPAQTPSTASATTQPAR